MPEALFMVFQLDSKGPKALLFRGRVLRPEDACPQRFSWFFNWIPKVQRNAKDACKSDRSRQELSNEYFVVTCKNRLDTAKNESLKVWVRHFDRLS